MAKVAALVEEAAPEIAVRIASCPGKIAGYYSLSAATFEKDELPTTLAKRLPRYPVSQNG